MTLKEKKAIAWINEERAKTAQHYGYLTKRTVCMKQHNAENCTC